MVLNSACQHPYVALPCVISIVIMHYNLLCIVMHELSIQFYPLPTAQTDALHKGAGGISIASSESSVLFCGLPESL